MSGHHGLIFRKEADALPKSKTKSRSATAQQVDQRVAKAFAHPLRVRILTILNEEVASPNLIAKSLGESLNLTAYHVRVLEKFDCIELVETRQRRGATEHFYRAKRHQAFSPKEWEKLPASVRPGLTGTTLTEIFADVKEATERGSFDARGDRHLSRTPLVIDETAWKEVNALLRQTERRLEKIQKAATERLEDSERPPILSKVEMLHFESPAAEET